MRVFDVGTDPATGLPFIVMERLSGHDLATELRARPTIPVPEAIDWIMDACAGLGEAHAAGIVHRDVKPSNLFLVDEQPRRVKVMDFGVSKLLAGADTELTTTNEMLGTPSYMAPEQLLSMKTIDHRADVWSLGVVLYRLLAGQLPFAAETQAALAVAIATIPPTPLGEVAAHLPAELVEAVMRALERDPARRPATTADFARSLQRFGNLAGFAAPAVTSTGALPLAGGATLEPAAASPPSTSGASPTPSGRSPRARAVVWLVAGGLTLVAVGAALGATLTGRGPSVASSASVTQGEPAATEAAPSALPDAATSEPPAPDSVATSAPTTTARPSSTPRPKKRPTITRPRHQSGTSDEPLHL